jgi:hypothetical protein
MEYTIGGSPFYDNFNMMIAKIVVKNEWEEI